MLTKESLEARAQEIRESIAKIIADSQQLGAQHNAHLGALSEIERLLKELNEKPAEGEVVS